MSSGTDPSPSKRPGRPGPQRGLSVAALVASANGEEDDPSNGPPRRCFGLLGGGSAANQFKLAIPTSDEELEHVERRSGADSWQMRGVRFLGGHFLQKFLVGLLLCDVVILFIELYLDAGYPSCNTVTRDAISCCPTDCGDNIYSNSNKHGYEDDGHRFLGGGGGGGPTCEYPLHPSPQHATTCDGHNHHAVHVAHSVLFTMTVGILSIFMVEILSMVAFLGPKFFFSRFLYVLDFFVVSSSLSLEVAFSLIDDAAAADVAGLLVVFRLWRFVRIGHGLVASTHEIAEHKMNKLKKYTRSLEEEVIRCGGVLPESKWSLGLLQETIKSSENGGKVKNVCVEIEGTVVNATHIVAVASKKRLTAEKYDSRSEEDRFEDDSLL